MAAVHQRQRVFSELNNVNKVQQSSRTVVIKTCENESHFCLVFMVILLIIYLFSSLISVL